MSINLDKFWAFVKEWSVGRLIALLFLLSLILCQTDLVQSLGRVTIFAILLLALLLEVFQLSADKLKPVGKQSGAETDEQAKEQSGREPDRAGTVSSTWPFVVTMILALLGVIGFATFVLCHLIQNG